MESSKELVSSLRKSPLLQWVVIQRQLLGALINHLFGAYNSYTIYQSASPLVEASSVTKQLLQIQTNVIVGHRKLEAKQILKGSI